ncbi:hydrolase [Parvularcula maris]|uniref:Hydrolase n=1 Tax=Parvularcula maris TaxID=2965077 RepID=A0A9X2LDR9_9PROT|nr:hydrolase [Parvularcula maris]MCQ8186622.1 hydrolase [Parvularcula maris]
MRLIRPLLAATAAGLLASLASGVTGHAEAQRNRGAEARPDPAASLLTPANHTLILIDHQPQMAFATNSIETSLLINNVTLVAKSAELFEVPTILTTVARSTFSGPIFPQLQAVFPDQEPIDRTSMNTWEDERVTDRVNEIGKDKIVIAALWTEVCGVFAVLSAIDNGYDVYFVTDASGGMSEQIHNDAITRMVEAGATPITSMQYLLELQRDWARGETYAATNEIVKEHGGAYGLGVLYAKEMFNASEGGE